MHDQRHQLIKLGQWGSALALALAILGLVWILIGIARDLRTPKTVSFAPNSAATGVAADAVPVSTLASLPLFGQRASALSVPVASRQTKLDLKLRGTVPGTDPDMGMAIIEANGRQQHYRVGDSIGEPEQATLFEVHRDHVVLARQGGNETLPLATQPAASTQRSSTRRSMPGGAMSLNRNPLPIDTRTLAQSIKAMPQFDASGQQLGFRLQVAPQYTDLLRQLGLRSTDVITAVDGVALNDPRAALALTGKLRGTDAVSVTIRRNGADRTLTIDPSTIINRLQ